MLQIDNVSQYIYAALENLNEKQSLFKRHIVIYGFSAQAKVVIAYLKKKENVLISLVDGDCSVQGKQYCGILINDPVALLREISSEAAVIVFDKGHGKRAEILKINPSLSEQIYEINKFNYSDFPCRLKTPKNARIIGLQEAQKELLDIFTYFDRFCRQHQLCYFLDGGSLLGAVRHGGIIPWDDDLDVTMPMPDYIKLCQLLPEICDSRYEFRCLHAERQEELSLSSISRLLSRSVITSCSNYPVHLMEGIGLDIWALAGFPDDEQEQEAYSLELEYMGDYWKENIVIPYGMTELSEGTYRAAQDILLKKMTKYDYNESNYVGYAYCGKILHILNGKNRAFSKKVFTKSAVFEFENERAQCPGEWDYYLTNCFGDYMRLPPEDERKCANSDIIYKLE